MNIQLYTATFGGYDTIRDTAFEGVCITDLVPASVKGWKYILMLYLVPPKERSFFCKTHPEMFFPEADVTVWIDGNLTLKEDPRNLVDKYLKDQDIFLYRHPDRTSIYQEGKFCAEKRKVKYADADWTLTWLKEQGYPDDDGLVETSFIVRWNTPEVREFNHLWWDMFRFFPAKRDQLSFNYVAWKLGMKYFDIPGYKTTRLFTLRQHMRSR